jgi:hypothetical protein
MTNTEDEKRFWVDDPDHPGKHIDTRTGIWPISEWGPSCGRGFVSNQRFARSPSEQVIQRTNRDTTRKWRAAIESPQTPREGGNR